MSAPMRVTLLSPQEIADKVTAIGVGKANMPLRQILLLGALAGAYIGFGSMFYTIVKADGALSFAVAQLLSGFVFALGLILVVVSGAELFTGNTMMLLAWSRRKISFAAVLKNWGLIIFANFIGAFILALLVYFSGHTDLNHGKIAATYVKVANDKSALSFVEAFCKGILCNILVCLAVWMAYAGHTIADKVQGVIFPVAAFVAAGFEHSVANMYILTMGLLEKPHVDIAADALSLSGALGNFIPVLLGNIVGGGVLVALVYGFSYPSGENSSKKS